MTAFSAAELREATGGAVRAAAPGAARGVSTDSRAIGEGELFVALVGPSFDGHDFLGEAFRRGAWGAVVERGALGREQVGRQLAAWPGRAVVAVGDTGRALGDLAAFHRRRLPVRVVGITGSNGKTTTKEMAAAVLGRRWRVHKTAGNFNNLVGLPLTLLRLGAEHEVAVLEMGMNRPGEIRRLAEIAAPEIGVVTNVTAAHLEGLGTLAGVIAAKAELLEALGAAGTAVLNADDPSTPALAASFRGRRLLFGRSPAADVRAEQIAAGPHGTAFTLATAAGRARVELGVFGEHNVLNALAAAAAGIALGADLAAVRDGLAVAQGVGMRFELRAYAPGVTVINDAYNANPASMRAALRTLGSVPRPGRLAVVLGDMLELGDQARAAHAALGREAAAAGPDLLLVVGEFRDTVAAAAREAGLAAPAVLAAADADAAARVLGPWLRAGDLVLLKGSRGMRLERVLAGLRAAGALGEPLPAASGAPDRRGEGT
jgi:UDP-N-acetylmuramoyl-tripeptide--D-alanyl-D-alanine ligase